MNHDTSEYVRIPEEYGSESCDFRTTTRVFSHSGPSIELKKDTRIPCTDNDIKTWLWVAYGMIAVKNVFKHPKYRPRVGCNCVDDIHRILSMARGVDFERVKEQWYYLLGETFGTDLADKVKDSPYWKGFFTYNMLYDANGLREFRLINILIDTPVWEIPSGPVNFDSSCDGASCPRVITSHYYPYKWETNNCTTTDVGYHLAVDHKVFDAKDNKECGFSWKSSLYNSKRGLYGYPRNRLGIWPNSEVPLYVK
ncbi:hypothetical protein ACROYT_G016525 [Oculina patagonica]